MNEDEVLLATTCMKRSRIADGFARQAKAPKKLRIQEVVDVIESSDEEVTITHKPINSFNWIDNYPPQRTTDLCVNKSKVAQVKAWIESNGAVLILSGPAGTGKTATVKVLATELGYELIEWQNPMSVDRTDRDAESLAHQFDRFLSVSDKYSVLDFGVQAEKKIVVVEDIPNTFSSDNSAARAFQSSVSQYLASSRHKYPLIIIVTETEPRGDDWRDGMNVRTLFNRDILDSSKCHQITFNEVAPTFVTKALTRIIDALPRSEAVNISTAVLEELASCCNGDIRSAINSLSFIAHKFSTNGRAPLPRRRKKRGEVLSLTSAETSTLNIITNREAALGYFHAIGKVLYNKGAERPENDAQALLDETSTDERTFIAGLHWNFTHSVSTLDQVVAVLESMSRYDVKEIYASSVIMTLQHELPRNGTFKSAIYYPDRKRYSSHDVMQPSYEDLIFRNTGRSCKSTKFTRFKEFKDEIVHEVKKEDQEEEELFDEIEEID